MIRLTCTNCKATLEMDDAFAGGVCRCKYCGTIQTVPSHLKQSGNVPQPAGAKTLYQTHASSPGTGTGTGLDELADIVASSGLGSKIQDRRGPKSGSGRTAAGTPSRAGGALPAAQGAPPPQHAVGYAAPRERPSSNKMAFILAGAGGAAVLCMVLALLLFRGGTSTPTGGGETGNPAPATTGPRFVNLPLNASRVVYVIDCGGSNQDLFDPLKHALYQSLNTLGPQRQFQVIFWQRTDGEEEPVAYPESGVAPATPEHIAACQERFADLTASGSTRVNEAIQLAMARQPGVVVLATAKPDVDDDFVQVIEQARAGADVKIHTVAVGAPNPLLKQIAQKTGGRHISVSRQVLEGL